MLGDFYMELENKKLELPGSIFSKTKNLFLLILLYGEAGIEKRKAMELLYQNDDGDESSQYGRFRVLVYRLKKYLIELGLMQENDTLHKKEFFAGSPRNWKFKSTPKSLNLQQRKHLSTRQQNLSTGPAHSIKENF